MDEVGLDEATAGDADPGRSFGRLALFSLTFLASLLHPLHGVVAPLFLFLGRHLVEGLLEAVEGRLLLHGSRPIFAIAAGVVAS